MRNNGFTLLEVLVALVIVALTFTAFFSGVSSISRNKSIIIEKTYAVWIAESLLNQIQLGIIQAPQVGKSIKSDLKMGGLLFHYRISSKETADKHAVQYEVLVFNNQSEQAFSLFGFGSVS